MLVVYMVWEPTVLVVISTINHTIEITHVSGRFDLADANG